MSQDLYEGSVVLLLDTKKFDIIMKVLYGIEYGEILLDENIIFPGNERIRTLTHFLCKHSNDDVEYVISYGDGVNDDDAVKNSEKIIQFMLPYISENCKNYLGRLDCEIDNNSKEFFLADYTEQTKEILEYKKLAIKNIINYLPNIERIYNPKLVKKYRFMETLVVRVESLLISDDILNLYEKSWNIVKDIILSYYLQPKVVNKDEYKVYRQVITDNLAELNKCELLEHSQTFRLLKNEIQLQNKYLQNLVWKYDDIKNLNYSDLEKVCAGCL